MGSWDHSPRALIWTFTLLCWDAVNLEEYSAHPLKQGWWCFHIPGCSWGGWTVQAARGRPEWPSRLRRSSSRPCQDDPHSLCEWGQVCHESDTMALILCADEVWRERRSEFCLCYTEQISQALDTQGTRRCVEATFLKMDFNISDVFKNEIAAQYNVPYCRQCAFHFPELSYSLKVSL